MTANKFYTSIDVVGFQMFIDRGALVEFTTFAGNRSESL